MVMLGGYMEGNRVGDGQVPIILVENTVQGLA